MAEEIKLSKEAVTSLNKISKDLTEQVRKDFGLTPKGKLSDLTKKVTNKIDDTNVALKSILKTQEKLLNEFKPASGSVASNKTGKSASANFSMEKCITSLMDDNNLKQRRHSESTIVDGISSTMRSTANSFYNNLRGFLVRLRDGDNSLSLTAHETRLKTAKELSEIRKIHAENMANENYNFMQDDDDNGGISSNEMYYIDMLEKVTNIDTNVTSLDENVLEILEIMRDWNGGNVPNPTPPSQPTQQPQPSQPTPRTPQGSSTPPPTESPTPSFGEGSIGGNELTSDGKKPVKFILEKLDLINAHFKWEKMQFFKKDKDIDLSGKSGGSLMSMFAKGAIGAGLFGLLRVVGNDLGGQFAGSLNTLAKAGYAFMTRIPNKIMYEVTEWLVKAPGVVAGTLRNSASSIMGKITSKIAKTASDIPPKVIGEVGEQVAELGSKAVGEAGKQVTKKFPNIIGWLGKVAKNMTKFAVRGIGKIFPGIGSIMDIHSAYKRFQRGDTTGALIDVAAAVANLIPALGIFPSLLLSGINAGRDLKNYNGYTPTAEFGKTLDVERNTSIINGAKERIGITSKPSSESSSMLTRPYKNKEAEEKDKREKERHEYYKKQLEATEKTNKFLESVDKKTQFNKFNPAVSENG